MNDQQQFCVLQYTPQEGGGSPQMMNGTLGLLHPNALDFFAKQVDEKPAEDCQTSLAERVLAPVQTNRIPGTYCAASRGLFVAPHPEDIGVIFYTNTRPRYEGSPQEEFIITPLREGEFVTLEATGLKELLKEAKPHLLELGHSWDREYRREFEEWWRMLSTFDVLYSHRVEEVLRYHFDRDGSWANMKKEMRKVSEAPQHPHIHPRQMPRFR